jgi:hypothetical protein
VFVDLTSHSEVHGRLARDTARPDVYRAEVRRNGIDRSYGVDYPSDGAAINASTPPSPGWSLPVPAELIRGTVDQLTAYFLPERQLAERGGCALVVPVFDGSALYNVRFTDIKSEALSANGYQNFAVPDPALPDNSRGDPPQSGSGRGHVSTREGLVCQPRGRRSDAAGADGIRDCFRHPERLPGGVTRARRAPPSDAGMSNY